jgi:hypothetical protein
MGEPILNIVNPDATAAQLLEINRELAGTVVAMADRWDRLVSSVRELDVKEFEVRITHAGAAEWTSFCTDVHRVQGRGPVLVEFHGESA